MPSAAVYRRRRQVVFGSLAIFLAFLLYVVVVAFAPISAAAVQAVEATELTGAPAQLALPEVGSNALSAEGFGVLGTSGNQEKIPLASIAKTVTALVILEKKPLESAEDAGPEITFTEEDVVILNQTQAELGSYEVVTNGLVLSEKDALTVMMLSSANNYAVSLSNWAFGSVDEYISAANEWAKKNGLSATTIADPAGIDSQTAASPDDLLQIGRLAMANQALANIVGKSSAEIPGIGEVTNGNKLLGHYGVKGIKTGTTTEAGACLLYSSVVAVGSGYVHFTGTSLGFDSHAELRDSVGALLMSAQAGFHEISAVSQGQAFATVVTDWGQSAEIIATESFTKIVWSDTPVIVTTQVNDFATGRQGDIVGKVIVTIGDEVFEVPLALGSDVAGPDLAWRMSHPGELF